MAEGKAKAKSCCMNNHDKHNTGSPLGKSEILASEVKKSILELLGSTDGEVQEKMKKVHSYIFDMGGGKYFENYEDAEDELLKRNFPDIFNNCQKGAVFVPETFLPKVPRAVVGTEEYEEQKQKLDEQLKITLGIKSGTEESQLHSGDLTELELSDTLKKFFAERPDEVIIFQGPKFKTPGANKAEQEHDFVLVFKKLKCIICIESKTSLEGKSAQKGLKSQTVAKHGKTDC